MKAIDKSKNGKILVQLWDRLHTSLSQRVEAACLRRDAFLDRVIQAELPYLEKEIQQPNSAKARDLLAEHLNRLPRKALTLTLKKSTIAELDRICEEKNIIRDAFFNRLVFCLLASEKLVDILFGADQTKQNELRDYGWDDVGEQHRGQALPCIRAHIDGPFEFLRACIEIARDATGDTSWQFYQVHIPEDLFERGRKDKDEFRKKLSVLGLNVYLSDSMVRGTPDWDSFHKEFDELIGIPEKRPRRQREKS